jgi:hypothetical protein
LPQEAAVARHRCSLGNAGIVDVIDAGWRLSQAQIGQSRAHAQRRLDTSVAAGC